MAIQELAKPVIICTLQYVQMEPIKHCSQEAKSAVQFPKSYVSFIAGLIGLCKTSQNFSSYKN